MRIRFSGVFILTIIGQGFGLIREMVLAGYFGISVSYDALNIVLNLFMTISAILSSIPLFLIPWVTQAKTEKSVREFNRLLSAIVGIVLCIAISIVIALEIFASEILTVAAPGLLANGSQFDLAVSILRYFAPVVILFGLSQLVKALCNLYERHYEIAIESILFNASLVFVIVVGFEMLNLDSVYCVVVGYYLSSALYFASCLVTAARNIDKTWLTWEFDKETTIRCLMATAEFMLANVSSHGAALMIYGFASIAGNGAASSLSYVNRLLMFSVGTAVNSMILVYFPRMTNLLVMKDREVLSNHLSRIMGVFLYVSLSAILVIAFMGEKLVTILFMRGAFDKASVEAVALLLLYYLPWVVFFPLAIVFDRVILGAKRYYIYTMANLVSVCVALGISPFLVGMGINGVGAISSIQIGVRVLLMWAIVTNIVSNKMTLDFLAKSGKPLLLFAVAVLVLSVARKANNEYVLGMAPLTRVMVMIHAVYRTYGLPR